MESLSPIINNVENRLIYIKDKTGVYFLKPFLDQKTKLLTIQNATMVAKSNDLIAVNQLINSNFRLLQVVSFHCTITLLLN